MSPSVALLRAAIKGALVGAVWLGAVVTFRLGLVLLPALLVGVVVAVLAAWKEQRTSRIGPWPAVVAGGAYVATVALVLAVMVNQSVADLPANRPATSSQSASLAPAGLVVGVAAVGADGQLCVAMGRPVTPGDALTLVQPVSPQSARDVTVLGSVATCERLAAALIPAPYYAVSEPSDGWPRTSSPLVAFLGVVTASDVVSNASTLSLRVADTEVGVRSCASHEGLHLTAWAGTPLDTERLWHQYYYLGYDLEPTCDQREVGGQ